METKKETSTSCLPCPSRRKSPPGVTSDETPSCWRVFLNLRLPSCLRPGSSLKGQTQGWSVQKHLETPGREDFADAVHDIVPRESAKDRSASTRAFWKSCFLTEEASAPKVAIPDDPDLRHDDVTADVIMAEVRTVTNVLFDLGTRLRAQSASPGPRTPGKEEEPDTKDDDADTESTDNLDERVITNQERHYIELRRQLADSGQYTKAEIALYFGTDEGCGENGV